MAGAEDDLRVTPALAALVEEGYALLDGPRPADHQACTACCMGPDSDRAFREAPLRALPHFAVDDWMHAAFDAPASPELRRYLLPRVLDFLTQGRALGLGTELTFQRFQTGKAGLWTAKESDFLERFCGAFLDAKAQDDRWGELDDVLCMFCIAGHAPEPLLARVWAWPDADLVPRLHRDWAGRGQYLHIWRTTFWEDHCSAADVVGDWYESPELMDRCFDASFDDRLTPEVRAMAETLYDGLRFP